MFEPDFQLRVEDEESLQLYVHVRYQKSGLWVKAECRKDDVWSSVCTVLAVRHGTQQFPLILTTQIHTQLTPVAVPQKHPL